MSDYHPLLGYWFDNSYSTVLGGALTLPMRWANVLISVLTLVVTFSASTFWAITAYLLHYSLVKRKDSTVIGFQHQVILRNSQAPSAALWDFIQIYLAWRHRSTITAWWRPLRHASLILVVWITFLVAGTFVSEVAGNNYANTRTLLAPYNCGAWHFDINTQAGLIAHSSKMLRDTIRARAYAGSWYQPSSSSLKVASLYPVDSLPYDSTMNTSCPFESSHCLKGNKLSFSLGTPRLDSHSMFGINTPKKNRVEIQKNVTCALIRADKLFEVAELDNRTLYRFNLGSIQGISDYTFQYDQALANSTVGYMLSPYYSGAGWEPDPLFNRADADVSMFVLTQNSVMYTTPVYDPWFYANGSFKVSTERNTYITSNTYASFLGCVDQYRICNPNTQQCTTHGSLEQVDTSTKTLGLNDAQTAVAVRLLNAASASSMFNSVFGLGSSALLAKEVLFDLISPGLPPNQWTLEVTRWFTTSLAKMQGSIVEYASNEDLGPLGTIATPQNSTDYPLKVRKEFEKQCKSQRIRSLGEVQSFSIAGLAIVIGVNLLLASIHLFLDSCIRCVWGRSSRARSRTAARQADDKLHLLRLALGNEADYGLIWEMNDRDIPMTGQNVDIDRPKMGPDGLVMYPSSQNDFN